MAVRAGS